MTAHARRSDQLFLSKFATNGVLALTYFFLQCLWPFGHFLPPPSSGKSVLNFVEAANDENLYLEREDRKLKGNSLLCFVIFSILSFSILIGSVVYFYMTDYDLTKELEAHSVIFRNRLIRAILSIVSLILVFALRIEHHLQYSPPSNVFFL